MCSLRCRCPNHERFARKIRFFPELAGGGGLQPPSPPPGSCAYGSDSNKQCPEEDQAKTVDPKEADNLPNAKPDSALQKLQTVVDDIVKKEQHQSTSVQLSVSRKKHGVFASCNVCKTEFSVRSISKGPYFLRQHLATQMHKTNTLIAHSRESDVLLELSELHSQIKTKFPNIFILKKSSAFCRACKTNMSLLGRNVMGNLVQHVMVICRMPGKVTLLLLPEILFPFLCPSQRKHRLQTAD